MPKAYVGRFAPSPSGPLHLGSLVAALASWLDARAHAGHWWLRIEDVDGPRTQPGAEQAILRQLDALGLHHDGSIMHQSARGAAYQAALDRLIADGRAYPCGCTRQAIASPSLAAHNDSAASPPSQDRIYPGICREGLRGKAARAWRMRLPNDALQIAWQDRQLGSQVQDLNQTVGDFVLKRADGPWAYQLAVVVDDAAQGITHVVRGQDLADNTARQIHLQHMLGLPAPEYLHVPLVLDAQGAKLSKSKGAKPVEIHDAAQALKHLADAAEILALPVPQYPTRGEWLSSATAAWRARYAVAL